MGLGGSVKLSVWSVTGGQDFQEEQDLGRERPDNRSGQIDRKRRRQPPTAPMFLARVFFRKTSHEGTKALRRKPPLFPAIFAPLREIPEFKPRKTSRKAAKDAKGKVEKQPRKTRKARNREKVILRGVREFRGSPQALGASRRVALPRSGEVLCVPGALL